MMWVPSAAPSLLMRSRWPIELGMRLAVAGGTSWSDDFLLLRMKMTMMMTKTQLCQPSGIGRESTGEAHPGEIQNL